MSNLLVGLDSQENARFNSCLEKQLRKYTVSLAVQPHSQENALFRWQFTKTAKEKRRVFLTAQKIRHEIIFSWLFVETATETLYSLAIQFWPPRKLLTNKANPVWCSDYKIITGYTTGVSVCTC
jgi:hypothetical protein